MDRRNLFNAARAQAQDRANREGRMMAIYDDGERVYVRSFHYEPAPEGATLCSTFDPIEDGEE